MAVTFQSATSALVSHNGASGGTITVNPPSGLSAGDAWIIRVVADADSGAGITVPSGFTGIATQQAGQDGWPVQRAFAKIAGASESAVVVSMTGGLYDCWADSIRVSGQHASAFIGNAATAQGTGTSNTLAAPTVTVQDDGNLVLLFFASEGDGDAAETIAVPGSSTVIQEREGTVYPNASCAYQARDTGSYSPGNWVVSRTNTDNLEGIALTVEIRTAGESSAAPTITDVDTDETITSTQTGWAVTGTGFDGATVEIRQGTTVVAQTINSQTATTINCDTVFESTEDLKYGDATLAVINADEQEATIAITIAPPSSVAYVDLAALHATAEKRITAIPDLAPGDQLEVSNVVGGTIADVTVHADGTFDCAISVTAFGVRAWDASDSTWGVPGTQTVGDPAGTEITPASVTTEESHGSATITNVVAQTFSPSAIASAEAHGSLTIAKVAAQTLSPGGVTSLEAFGSVALSHLVQSILASAIATGEGFGDLALVQLVQTVAPASVDSIEAFGTHTLATAAQVISVGSIASSEALGDSAVARLAAQELILTGIASAEGVGSLALAQLAAQAIVAGGIAGSEDFGEAAVADVVLAITATGIPSTEVFGNSLLSTESLAFVSPSSVPSLETFGSQIVAAEAAQDIAPGSVASAEVFGDVVLESLAQSVTVGSIASLEAFGGATLDFALQTISPEGIATDLRFGRTTLEGGLIVEVDDAMFVQLTGPVFVPLWTVVTRA